MRASIRSPAKRGPFRVCPVRVLFRVTRSWGPLMSYETICMEVRAAPPLSHYRSLVGTPSGESAVRLRANGLDARGAFVTGISLRAPAHVDAQCGVKICADAEGSPHPPPRSVTKPGTSTDESGHPCRVGVTHLLAR